MMRRYRLLSLAIPALMSISAGASVTLAAEPLVVPAKIRLLVVAPHPDDESLGAAGLIQQTLAAGGRVHILFVTDGDGYPEAVKLATGHRQPGPSDYRGFGELRRAEALVALEHYGVLPVSVSFLGFPDGGLAAIWRRGPTVSPYRSPYTREESPAQPGPTENGARYVSQDLIHAFARTVAMFDPDWIVLPTPRDNHPDHCASFTFVLAALNSLAAAPGGAEKLPARLLTYLVHAGDWPPPSPASEPLPEPRQIFSPARWYSLALTDAQVRTKLAGLEEHRSQAAVMEGFFRAFARPNELFGIVDKPALAKMKAVDFPCPEVAH